MWAAALEQKWRIYFRYIGNPHPAAFSRPIIICGGRSQLCLFSNNVLACVPACTKDFVTYALTQNDRSGVLTFKDLEKNFIRLRVPFGALPTNIENTGPVVITHYVCNEAVNDLLARRVSYSRLSPQFPLKTLKERDDDYIGEESRRRVTRKKQTER